MKQRDYSIKAKVMMVLNTIHHFFYYPMIMTKLSRHNFNYFWGYSKKLFKKIKKHLTWSGLQVVS